MKFTFGIITGGEQEQRINQIINSIEAQMIPEYEVIVVGKCNLQRNKTLIVPFNENIKPMWITKKKNIITHIATYENIVYMHDYIILDSNWYKGFLKFGEDFKICMTKMIQMDGSRFRDWSLWAEDATALGLKNCFLPYDMIHLSKYMYISGAYWIAKKEVMMQYPLDERLTWGYGEDVLWSKQVRTQYNFSMNPFSIVGLLKYNNPAFKLLTEEEVNRMRLMK